MGTSILERHSPSTTLQEALAAGPLRLEATLAQPEWGSRFERHAKRVLVHPLYPRAVRWFLIGVFFILTYSAFWGPHDPRVNFASVMVWIVWWPSLAVSFLLLGRVWCAFCPMGALSDFVHRKIGLNRKAPTILKNRWLVAALLTIAIFYQAWIEEVTRASSSSLVTGLILWSFAAGAILFGFVFERWTWCRHLCPLGAWSGVFAMSSVIEVRADPEICLAKRCNGIYCYFGRENLPGCPFHQVPRIMETNRYCSTCGNCLKACPNDALSVHLRWPSREFSLQRKEMLENSLISIAAVGVVVFQVFVMTGQWTTIHQRASRLPLLSSDAFLCGVVLLFSAVLAIALFMVASMVYAHITKQAPQQEMSRFGFVFLPLALMGHIAHNLGHLHAGYRLIWGATAGLIGHAPTVPIEEIPNNWPWVALQLVLILIGLGMSIWGLRRVCSARRIVCPGQPAAIPYVALAAFFALVMMWLFALPMLTRM